MKKLLLLIFIALALQSCGKIREIIDEPKGNAPSLDPVEGQLPSEDEVKIEDVDLKSIIELAQASPVFGKNFKVEAQKSYSPTRYVDFEETFLREREFKIPRFAEVTEGFSGNHWVTYRFKGSVENYDDVTCVYRGLGEKSKSKDCKSNGTQYEFQYCLNTSIFLTNGCNGNPWKKQCEKSENILPIHYNSKVFSENGTDIFSASYMKLTVNNGDSGCDETQVELSFEQPAAATSICGGIIDFSYTLNESIECEDEQSVGLVIRGEGVVFNGNSHYIYTPNAKVGVLVLGSNHKVEQLQITGKFYGVGMMAYETENLNLLDITVFMKWIGLDWINAHSFQESDQITTSQIVGLKIRERQSIE